MPADLTTWLKQGVGALATVLRASPDFMSPQAEGAPQGAAGVVLEVLESDAYLPPEAPPLDIFSGVFFAGATRSPQHDTAGQREYFADYRIEIIGKATPGETDTGRRGRPELWDRCLGAASVIAKIVAGEIGAGGGAFGGFSNLAWPTAVSTREQYDEDDDLFVVAITVTVRLQVTLVVD